MEDLIELIRASTSTVEALSNWLDVESLELDRVISDTAHRLTEHERALLVPHPGVFYGYHRTAFLSTPRPSSRVIAEVQATVLLGRLPEDAANEVLRARRTLGSVLLDVGATREFLSVSRGGRWDAGGNPIAFRSSFMFFMRGRPVAVVREDVHESTITLREKTQVGKHSKKHADAVDQAARAVAQLPKVTTPRGHVMQPTSGVERDLREAEIARHDAYGQPKK